MARSLPMTTEQELAGLVKLIRDLEWSCAGRCPECGYPKPAEGNKGHSWHCQLAQCLDYFDMKGGQ